MSVLIIMGSKSDSAIAEKAAKTLDSFGVTYKTVVASAHRTPEHLMKVVKESDAKIFIGIAGLSAALPGAIASYTHRPVIGVPVSGKVNLDAILSITQMPPGIPVAAVGLDNGENAALLAAEILALNDPVLDRKIQAYREEKRKAILDGS
jgi:5-(carboxyamino)imidazole ribonucleotide mutase